MTENAVHLLAENDLGHFNAAKFWPGPSLDWQFPHWHLMGFLCSSSLLGLVEKSLMLTAYEGDNFGNYLPCVPMTNRGIYMDHLTTPSFGEAKKILVHWL